MRYVRISIATLGLILSVVPSVLLFVGLLTHDAMKTMMIVGTLLWFVAAIPRWVPK